MTSAPSDGQFRIGYVVVLLTGLLLVGCGWQERISFTSPSGAYRVVVQQRQPFGLMGARVVLRSDETERTLEEYWGDSYISFVHCWWAPDETKFAVFVDGLLHYTVADDIVREERLDGKQWEAEIIKDIVRSYGLDPQLEEETDIRDVYHHVGQQFSERHPEFWR